MSNPRLWHLTMTAQVSVIAWGRSDAKIRGPGVADCWEDVLVCQRDWISMCHCSYHKIWRKQREMLNCLVIVEHYLDNVDPR